MAVVIDATVGGENSNSYVTLDEANTYFEARLNVKDWTDADDDTKNRSLVQATRRIDYEDFLGDRETNTQALKFPRVNIGRLDGIDLDGIIPLQIKEAQYELAIYMLSVDTSQPSVNANTISEVSAGSVSVKYHIDSNDNVTQRFDMLPPNVVSLLQEISRSVNDDVFFPIGR